MYIIASVTIIALLEIVAMVSYRLWEIERGRINLAARIAHYEEVIGAWKHTFFDVLLRIKEKIAHAFSHTALVLWEERERLKTRTRFHYVKNMIDGRGDTLEKRGIPSVYLKDITAHKDTLKEYSTVAEEERSS